MQNIKLNKRIYLSGGGNEHQSFPLDKFFLDTLKNGGKFLYIPIALRGHKLFPTANFWMNGILKMHSREDISFEVMDDPSKYVIEDLERFDAIYIGGGNTWSLIKELKESGFSTILLSAIEKGIAVYGGSAGAIILGKRIDTHDDENKVELKEMSGFNQLENYSIACHFKSEDSERFKQWATDHNLPIICLPEETGLVIENSLAKCVGEKPCTVYKEGGSILEIKPEESFEIK